MATMERQVIEIHNIQAEFPKLHAKINKFMEPWGTKLQGASILNYSDGTSRLCMRADDGRKLGQSFPERLKRHLQYDGELELDGVLH